LRTVPPLPPAAREPSPPEPLWREALGQRLRALRLGQRETLSQTAGRAGISPQYLSEVERGRKEPSSEMIAALTGALGTTLTELAEQVAGDLRGRTDTVSSRAAITSRAAGPVILALAA
jgi:transcriptional regulator with XRE-family HTH domain